MPERESVVSIIGANIKDASSISLNFEPSFLVEFKTSYLQLSFSSSDINLKLVLT